MLHQLNVVYDVKVGAYAKPVAVPADAAGVRAFGDACNDPSTEYYKHPEDYTFWNIGTYDDSSGQVVSSKPRQLASAVALKQVSVV